MHFVQQQQKQQQDRPRSSIALSFFDLDEGEEEEEEEVVPFGNMNLPERRREERKKELLLKTYCLLLPLLSPRALSLVDTTSTSTSSIQPVHTSYVHTKK